MEERAKHLKTCSKCWETFIYFPEEAWWDYNGSENRKLVKCPICNQIQTIQYEKQGNINYDIRYYK